MRKLFHVFLSFMIVYATTTSAFAASGWSVTNAVSSGSRVIVTATKGGYKSAVNIAPSAGRLALKVGKGANWASLLYAAIQLAPDLADIDSFKPDYANNRVSYRKKANTHRVYFGSEYFYDPMTYCKRINYTSGVDTTDAYYESKNWQRWTCSKEGSADLAQRADPFNDTSKPLEYLSIPSLASKVAANAATGHAASREAVQQTAIEMVAAGDFDKDLLAGAVPINDSRPLIPSAPITGNGNVATGDNGLMTGGDVGAAADAAIAAADAARKSAAAAADAAKQSAEDARRAADDAVDVINSAVDQAIKDAAKAVADAKAEVAADAKAVADAAAAKAAETAKDAAKAAEDAKAVADEGVKAAEDAAAKAAEGDKAVADKAVADARAEAAKAAERAADAEKVAEKAKAEAVKPFELPAFCSWATPVCDAIDWLKKDPASVAPMPVPVDDAPPSRAPSDFDVDYVNFGGQCPSVGAFTVPMGSVSVPMSFDMTPLCGLAVKIRPVIIAMAYFIGLGVVVAAIRES